MYNVTNDRRLFTFSGDTSEERYPEATDEEENGEQMKQCIPMWWIICPNGSWKHIQKYICSTKLRKVNRIHVHLVKTLTLIAGVLLVYKHNG